MSNILITFTLLTTPCLITIVFLSQKCLATLTTQQLKQVPSAQNWQALQEYFKTVNKLSVQPTKLRVVKSVKKFGAVGNGIADDTKAIQAAIDAASQAGGGIVFFPSGTYKVTINPSTLHAITIRPKVTLQGSGNQESVIKLAVRQGNYISILTGERPDSDLSYFAMYDLKIDGNGLNNPVRAESDFEPKKLTMRHSIQIYIGSIIHIERCRFTNQNNVNTITVNGNLNPQTVSISNIYIKNNIFELIGGGDVDYDHSTIYSHGERIEIANNYFSSRNGAATNGARTAIEIHGDEHTIKDNVITGFTNGIFVTGVARSSNNQLVTGNLIKEAHSGITIWSYIYKWPPIYNGDPTKPAISNCTIINNKISLSIDGWRSLWGNSPSVGISLESNSDAPFKNLNILNNEISFTNFSGAGRVSDNLANGIRLWRHATPNVVSENLRILGNKIKKSLAGGIYVSMAIRGGEISENTIINPGQSKAKFHDDYRAAILVDGVFNDMKINKNLLIDNQKINTLKGAIISLASCRSNCQMTGNYLHVNSGAKLPIFSSKLGRFKAFDISH